MAKLVLLTEYVALNGTDLSEYCSSGELQVEVEAKDVTTFGDGGWMTKLGGLKSATLALKFKQDFAATELDSIMWPLLGTVVTFEVRPTSSAVGASNPKYTGSVLINAWNPLEGSVGDEATVSVSYPSSGTVTRATA